MGRAAGGAITDKWLQVLIELALAGIFQLCRERGEIIVFARGAPIDAKARAPRKRRMIVRPLP
jgi:hypothetical protein